MRHGVALLFFGLSASGCATPAQLPARIGLSEAEVLRLEIGDWERTMRTSRLDPGSLPITVRRLRCWHDLRRTYRCSYDVDYGVAGNVAGSIWTYDMYFGRDDRGEWSRWIAASSTNE